MQDDNDHSRFRNSYAPALVHLRHAGRRTAQRGAHPADPGEAARRHDAAADVRAAVRLRLRRRDPRRRRQLPGVPGRRDPGPDHRLRNDGTGDLDRDGSQGGRPRAVPLAADVAFRLPVRTPDRGVLGDAAGDRDHDRQRADRRLGHQRQHRAARSPATGCSCCSPPWRSGSARCWVSRCARPMR